MHGHKEEVDLFVVDVDEVDLVHRSDEDAWSTSSSWPRGRPSVGSIDGGTTERSEALLGRLRRRSTPVDRLPASHGRTNEPQRRGERNARARGGSRVKGSSPPRSLGHDLSAEERSPSGEPPPPNEKMRRCPPRNAKGSWRRTLGGGDTTNFWGGGTIHTTSSFVVVLAVDEIELVVVALDEVDLVARSLDDEDKLAQPGTR